MKFVVKRPEENILNLVRSLGYRLEPGRSEEFNCVRSIGEAGYPRFHLFIKEEKDKSCTFRQDSQKVQDKLVFNLHLDQKRPSYLGSTAHSGEYEGKVVEEEAERIKRLFKM